jgi:hypothetical protein
LGRNDRFDLNIFCFINTSVLDVLRRRVQFTQYCSHIFQAALASYGMRSSMSRRGNCWDTQSTMALSAASDLTRAGIGTMPLR